MSIIPLLALPPGLEMTACSRQEETVWVSLLSTQSCSHCPVCGTPATRIHSRYQRKLADLPSAGQPVCFLLSARKFFCEVPTCPRKIFAERLAPFVAPWARVTARLFQMVQIIGLATGGRPGIRVTDRMGIQTSRHSILRRIMALPTESDQRWVLPVMAAKIGGAALGPYAVFSILERDLLHLDLKMLVGTRKGMPLQ